MQELAAEWLGWGYPDGERQEAPRAVQGWPAALLDTGTRVIDCSSFATWMIFALYPDDYDLADYAALQIFDAAAPWSNIEWILNRGIGEERAPVFDEWAYVQTWEGVPGRSAGHARLVMMRSRGEVLSLESTVSRLARGPQWRAMSWQSLTSRAACRAVVLR